ncbi:unnamed protein product, partial [Candidula unifasciata]
SAIRCYYCDNSNSAACGQDFKAYQFNSYGWIGVIRSCYYPGSGDLPGINETVGCHHYVHDKYNFTALYCFCDTEYCNQAPHICLTQFSKLWMVIVTLSALVCRVL